jgi:hypothetical protein
MESSKLSEQNIQSARDKESIFLTDKHINNTLRRSHSVERLISQSNIKIKTEAISTLHELRLIIQLQSLELSGHVY